MRRGSILIFYLRESASSAGKFRIRLRLAALRSPRLCASHQARRILNLGLERLKEGITRIGNDLPE
jgi:hypothetical protein